MPAPPTQKGRKGLVKAAPGSCSSTRIWTHYVFNQLSNFCGSQFAYCTTEGPVHISVASSARLQHIITVAMSWFYTCLNTVPPMVDNEHSSSTAG